MIAHRPNTTQTTLQSFGLRRVRKSKPNDPKTQKGTRVDNPKKAFTVLP